MYLCLQELKKKINEDKDFQVETRPDVREAAESVRTDSSVGPDPYSLIFTALCGLLSPPVRRSYNQLSGKTFPTQADAELPFE